MLNQNGVWCAALAEQYTKFSDEGLHLVNKGIKPEIEDSVLRAVNDRSLGRHLTGSLLENEGVKCQHELVML